MKSTTAFYLFLCTLFVSPAIAQYATQDTVHFAGEKYFKNIGSIIKNELAKIGERTAYVRIVNPDNQILGKPEYSSGNFVTDEGDTLKFSLKADFNYRGEKEDISLEFQDVEKSFKSGKYKVEIYIGGYKATSTTLELK